MKFYILAGLPGSGKSTTANSLKQKEKVFVVSPDALRSALNSGVYPRGDDYALLEPLVWGMAFSAARSLLQKGCSVAVDATNLTKKDRKKWIDLARENAPSAEIVIVWHVSKHDSAERWASERGVSGQEYRQIREKMEADVEPPAEEQGIKVITK